jgi:uncharacterized protein (TIGR00730 family)
MKFWKRIKEYLNFLKSWGATSCRLLWGMWKLTRLPQPAITVFGSSRMVGENEHTKLAFELAKKLTTEGFSIITGGGPGIMAAANQGALEAAKEFGVKNGEKKLRMKTVGISLTSFTKESMNPYVQDEILMKHFFTRKWLLVRYSIGFVVFPGGFGTLDELFEIVTLEQCYRMPKMPIILMDKEYWKPLTEWIKKGPLAEKLIDKKDLELFTITDDVDEAYDIIMKYCKGKCKIERPLYTR